MGVRIETLKTEHVSIGAHITLTLLGVFERRARIEVCEQPATGKERKQKLMLEVDQTQTIAPGIAITLLGFMRSKMGVRLDIVAPAGVNIGDVGELKLRLMAAAIERAMTKRYRRMETDDEQPKLENS
jgi:hypothetical protein